MLSLTQNEIDALASIQNKIYDQNCKVGWHGQTNKREFGTLIALMHSELSEALEGDRKDLMDEHLPERKMAEVELADCIIRILDCAGREGFDIAGALAAKHDYNRSRADHKKEIRDQANGKKY